ncbi:sensor histidine kinase [Actinoplanes sp. GCM10030250]|uniref:sensor histidine kinase n=1 Tax=Actinoplanes sp. GCM10030250 TaxID=3273376 RepID=UPI00360B3A02
MSFRLRIFLLVLVVAVTAIGATAWLTLSLTSREMTQADQARDQHQATILEEIRMFGVRQGRWSGIDKVVAEQSERTGLHIRVVTRDDEVLTDSDAMAGRSVGPVQMVPAGVAPVPRLDPSIVRWAEQQADVIEVKRRSAQARLGRDPAAALRVKMRPFDEGTLAAPELPANLFGPIPAAGAFTDPVARALFQIAQYRAALVASRCIAETEPVEPMMGLDVPPYLTGQQLASDRCVRNAVVKVRGDGYWLDLTFTELSGCMLPAAPEPFPSCLSGAFSETAASTTAVPVEIYFGAQPRSEMDQLSRPAVFGAAALLVVAALGTAWIARRVSRPVRLLTGASLQLAAGRLDVRVPAGGEDELARLAASFNTMAEALQRSEEQQRRLIADVAHELRTPLSNLRGYLEGLADGVIEPTPELFASLHEETLLQRRILDDLQVLALAEAGDLAYSRMPLDLAELAETGATAHRAVAAAAGIELVVEAPRPVRVEADPDRIRQVLSNLLSNAIRYTDAGGRVEIRVERVAHSAMLSVRDSGVGMTPEEVARVFDRFWRADPARQRATGGSGLGLTIVQRIVGDHGGTVEAVSAPGLGTTFTVRFPSAPANSAATLSGVLSSRARREIKGK